MDKKELDEIYQREAYYWGKEPSELAQRLLSCLPAGQRSGRVLFDLGAGEGRDSVYFARHDLHVVAIDISAAGLAKAERLAAERGTSIQTQVADINAFHVSDQADIIYSIGALQYLQPTLRKQQFEQWQTRTKAGGLHAMFVFVDHPDVAQAPDWGVQEYLYARDELLQYYSAWHLLYQREYIFDCDSSGIPHRHAACEIIVQKPIP